MNYSQFFVTDPSFVHLNAGSLTRTPREVLDFIEDFRRDEEKNPTRALFVAPQIFSAAQELIAKEFSCKAEDLFFRSNITSALNDFLFAVPLKGKEILCSSWEYGATENLARVRAEQSGLSFRKVELPIGEATTGKEIEERILSAISDETAALIVSHVATGVGTILPLNSLVSKARARGCVVVIDGAHAPGSVDLNINQINADFYGGNLHKWFLGPKGTAFGWVNPVWRGKLSWKFGGWASFSVPSHFTGVFKDVEAASRFFPGTMDTAPFAALSVVQNFWDQHGRVALRSYQNSLRDLIAKRGAEFGWKVISPKENLGPLITFELPKAWGEVSNLAYRLYTEANVQVAVPNVNGKSVLRFSPGVYISKVEVELGLKKLQSWKP